MRALPRPAALIGDDAHGVQIVGDRLAGVRAAGGAALVWCGCVRPAVRALAARVGSFARRKRC
jgi:hypothetical protein